MVHTYYGLFIDDAPIRMYIHNKISYRTSASAKHLT